ncbi:galactokinase [Rhabdothermincola salaria]|uniref:galactokinase n=1 Tax=Rhabdothermincola salaria TaxID=2903142 RepID=UPI001E409C6A|nr:galactokinase [Rhabdothermincola salaria]
MPEPESVVEVRAFAPGRVNLIGDHTDHAGGLALPMAVDLGTTVTGRRGGAQVHLVSTAEDAPADVPLTVTAAERVEPAWARYVAGVVAELRPRAGFEGRVDSTVPVGAGLSSSAALELAVALALGFDGPALDLARLGRRAERRASGVPCGLMDQLTSACGVAGHALLVDFTAESFTLVPVPVSADVVVVHSGVSRALAGSRYAERQAQCRAAAAVIGPLAEATSADVATLRDPVLQRRARHVVTENARVRAMATALGAGDLAAAGAAMLESHASLRHDFEVSVPALDRAVEQLMAQPGVVGARLTGAGFGGCVVALTERGAVADPRALTGRGWRVQASGGAHVETSAPPGR